MNEKPQKFTKNAQNARSGPWWDRTRPKLGLETTTIVFSIPIGFRNRINLLLILKSRFCWTQLVRMSRFCKKCMKLRVLCTEMILRAY